MEDPCGSHSITMDTGQLGLLRRWASCPAYVQAGMGTTGYDWDTGPGKMEKGDPKKSTLHEEICIIVITMMSYWQSVVY